MKKTRKPTWQDIQPEIQRLMAAIKSQPTDAALRSELRAVLLPFAVIVERVHP